MTTAAVGDACALQRLMQQVLACSPWMHRRASRAMAAHGAMAARVFVRLEPGLKKEMVAE